MVRRRKQTPSQKPSQKTTSRSGATRDGKAPMGSVRIISGLWRGRKLPVHDAEGLRPTTDRVKETVFNWLAQDIPHAKVLDLFAGSGSLGFEAASRQAAQVTMIELNDKAYQQIISNVALVKADNIVTHHGNALSFLDQPGQPHDVVFIDPPFRQGLLPEVVQKLEDNGWLADNALVYIETEKELQIDVIPEHWDPLKEKTAGQVCYRLFERETK